MCRLHHFHETVCRTVSSVFSGGKHAKLKPPSAFHVSTSQSTAAASTTLISFPLVAAVLDRLLIGLPSGQGLGITDPAGHSGVILS